MKRLPDSELELMMIIWDAGRPMSRNEIEEQLPGERQLSATTILSFLSRLQEKRFVFLPDGRYYTIAVLVKDSAESAEATARVIADISEAVYRYVVQERQADA